MSDAATMAARRAFNQVWPDQGDFEFEFQGVHRAWATLAAREALAWVWPNIQEIVEASILACTDVLIDLQVRVKENPEQLYPSIALALEALASTVSREISRAAYEVGVEGS